jgi:CRISPR-associated protein Cas5d
VLSPIRWLGFRRNEENEKASSKLAERAMRGKGPLPRLLIDERRTQRHTLALRDVDYVLEAGFRMSDRAGHDDNPAKFGAMFERRLERGQCYRMPYLGCREFVADVRPQIEPFEPVPETRDLGWMLHDLEFGRDGRGIPHFFHARIERGVIEVPELDTARRVEA